MGNIVGTIVFLVVTVLLFPLTGSIASLVIGLVLGGVVDFVMKQNRAEREKTDRKTQEEAEAVKRKLYEEFLRQTEAERLQLEEQRRRAQQRELFEENARQEAAREAQWQQDKRSREESGQQKRPHQGGTSAKGEKYYRDVLGVARNSSIDEIRQKYRALVTQYHPDKVNHLGPKLKQLAEDEMKRINEAYEFLRKSSCV